MLNVGNGDRAYLMRDVLMEQFINFTCLSNYYLIRRL